MASDAKSIPIAHARVTAVIPVEDRGRHELLRLAAGLGEYLQPEFGEALGIAAHSEDIIPPHVATAITSDVGQGALARVEGRHLALGRYGYLVQLGLVPKPADVHVARHIEATGNVALYLMVVEDGHCLGILGIELR